MDKKQALTDILKLLKAAKEDPKAFAELTKANRFEQKTGLGGQAHGNVKRAIRATNKPVASGVHDTQAMYGDAGVSQAGYNTRLSNIDKKGGPGSYKESRLRAAKGFHRNILNQLKQLPNPNLPKSEVPMNKSVLDIAKELLKAHKEDPKAFEQLTKGMAAPAMAPNPSAPKAPPAAPKTAAPKAPAMKAPAAAPKAPMMKEENCGPKMMSKEEIQADIKKEWKPKFKKG
jgi:hypothetical protein